jgi:DnaJ family protein C protein 1
LGDARDGDGEYTGTKWLDMVVHNSQVFLVSTKKNSKLTHANSFNKQLDPSGEMHLVDDSTAIRPAINSTWFIALFLSLVNRFTGPRLHHAKKEGSSAQHGGTTTTMTNNDVKPNVDSDDSTSSEAPDSEASTSKKKGERVKMPTVKAGGMRRKNLRKR